MLSIVFCLEFNSVERDSGSQFSLKYQQLWNFEVRNKESNYNCKFSEDMREVGKNKKPPASASKYHTYI